MPIEGIRRSWDDGLTVSMVTASINSNLAVGLCKEDQYGNKYILVYNDGNSMIPPTCGCTPASGTTTGYSVTVSAISGSSPLAGVPASVTIPTGQYGFIATSGFKRLTAASLIASANNGLLLSSAGIFSQQSFTTGLSGSTGAVTEPFISSNNVCGWIVSTTTAAFGYVDAFFKSNIYPS